MTPTPAPTRRKVVRTAAHLTWSTPVIVAATAAPALAASTPPSVVTSNVSGTVVTTTDEILTLTATFTNQGSQAVSDMTVDVTVDPIFGTIQSADPANVTGGFDFLSRSGNSGGRTYTFFKSDPQLTGAGTPGASTTLTFEVPASPDLSAALFGNVTATPMPNPGSGTPGAGVWA